MKVGDLVKSNAGTMYRGVLGIIIDEVHGWPTEPLDKEQLFEVFYADGSLVKWPERNLEVVI